MKSINLFILNILLIGGLTIPTCNKAKAAETGNRPVVSKAGVFDINKGFHQKFPFKNYPQ